MTPSLMELPWYMLLSLASGYAGYFVSHIGIRDHHKPIDITFATLVFGFIGLSCYQILLPKILGYVSPADVATGIASIITFLATVLCGVIWAKAGRTHFLRFLRITNTTYNDDLPSAWAALLQMRSLSGMQLFVTSKEGTLYHCEDLSKFANKPNGPCVLGASKDILMYVTHIRKKDAALVSCGQVLDESWGDLITYIPSDQVSLIEIRRRAR